MAANKGPKYNETIYVVEGASEFPLDMARYDCCAPLDDKDASAMRGSYDDEGPGSHPAHASAPSKRRVALRSFRQVGGDASPTYDRWRSFRWEVVWHGTREQFQAAEGRLRTVGAK